MSYKIPTRPLPKYTENGKKSSPSYSSSFFLFFIFLQETMWKQASKDSNSQLCVTHNPIVTFPFSLMEYHPLFLLD